METQESRIFTVKDFASRVGVSASAVYQGLNGRLKPYVKKGKSGQVYITADALELYKEKASSQPVILDKDVQALKSENERLKTEITKLTLERDNLREQLAREQEISRERLTRLEAADRRIDSLLDKIPPMLPAGNAGGGLFGWLKRKKGDTNT